MKNKHKLWYIGYIVSAILVPIILFTDFPKTADIGLLILMSIIFSISHTQLMHNRMMKNDIDYKVNVMDERNIWKYHEYDYYGTIRYSNSYIYFL